MELFFFFRLQVHSVHASKIISSYAARLRRFCKHCARGEGSFSHHPGRSHAIQRVATINSKVSFSYVQITTLFDWYWGDPIIFKFRSQSCNKDLWIHINAALQQNSKWHKVEPWLAHRPQQHSFEDSHLGATTSTSSTVVGNNSASNSTEELPTAEEVPNADVGGELTNSIVDARIRQLDLDMRGYYRQREDMYHRRHTFGFAEQQVPLSNHLGHNNRSPSLEWADMRSVLFFDIPSFF